MGKQSKSAAAADSPNLAVKRPAIAEGRRVAEGFGNAAAVVGPVRPGLELFAVTRGQVGLVDLVSYLLEQLGGGRVSVWTWAVSDNEARAFEFFLSSPLVTAGVAVLDFGTVSRNPGLIRRWLDRFGDGSVRACRNHAKIATIAAGARRFVCRGSMNLDQHEILEQFDVSECRIAFDYVAAVESALEVVTRASLQAEAASPRPIGELVAFRPAEIRPLSGIRTWKP